MTDDATRSRVRCSYCLALPPERHARTCPHATPDRVAVFVEECRRDPRWQEAKGEMGAIAHGYYGAVEGAMEAAAEIAFDKAYGAKGSERSGHDCPEPHSCDDDRCWP